MKTLKFTTLILVLALSAGCSFLDHARKIPDYIKYGKKAVDFVTTKEAVITFSLKQSGYEFRDIERDQ